MVYTDIISLEEAKNYLRIDDDLTELENTLNETNDISGFVTKLRLKFQQYSLSNV